jgi:hypothetical protein
MSGMKEYSTRCGTRFPPCGNTINCNHPIVTRFLVNCLEWWVEQMGVDGFRFDLANKGIERLLVAASGRAIFLDAQDVPHQCSCSELNTPHLSLRLATGTRSHPKVGVFC